MSAPEKIFVTVEYIGKTDTVVCGAFGTSPMDESVEFTRTDLSQASVAAALEAAAKEHDAEIVRLEAQIIENKNYLRLVGKSERSSANDFCNTAIGHHRGSAVRLRDLITPAQHDALAAHVAAEVAKARAEWVGSHCKELTAADRAHVIAHLSYELEPVGKPPTWNQLAMEIVRLSNALAQIGAKP